MSTERIQASIDAYWSGRAEGYHDFQESRVEIPEIRDAWASIWSDVLPSPPATILEPGAGTGHVALMLAHLGHDVVGIDRSRGMVARARANAARVARPATFREDDAVAPRLDERSVDAIVARYLLWTLREPVVALRNWRMLLRPRGTLAIVDSTWFADGPPGGTADDGAESAEPTDAFARHYDDEVLAALPLATARSIDDTVATVRDAGFLDVEVRALPELLELDHRYGVAPGHRLRLQHLITARAADDA